MLKCGISDGKWMSCYALESRNLWLPWQVFLLSACGSGQAGTFPERLQKVPFQEEMRTSVNRQVHSPHLALISPPPSNLAPGGLVLQNLTEASDSSLMKCLSATAQDTSPRILINLCSQWASMILPPRDEVHGELVYFWSLFLIWCYHFIHIFMYLFISLSI